MSAARTDASIVRSLLRYIISLSSAVQHRPSCTNRSQQPASTTYAKNATVPTQLLYVQAIQLATYHGALHTLPANACPSPLAQPTLPPPDPLVPTHECTRNQFGQNSTHTTTGVAMQEQPNAHPKASRIESRLDIAVRNQKQEEPCHRSGHHTLKDTMQA